MADNIRPAGVFDTNYDADMALNRTKGDKLRVYGGFGLLLLIPIITQLGFLPSYLVTIINNTAILVIAAQGLNILIGYAGQISLGHAAFMAVGAYSAALLAKGIDIAIAGNLMEIGPFPFWVAIPLATLFTGIVGLIFGLPSLRVKGFYLAMATLAAQFIIPWLIENPLEHWTNAPSALQRIPAPNFFGIILDTPYKMYYLIVPLSVFLMLIARNIIRTRTGRAFISIRDNDLAAELLGINVFWYKLQAFFISAMYAGVAGALLAFDRGSLNPEFFTLEISVALLAMLVIGGAGFPLAPLFGVAVFELLTSWLIPAVGPLINAVLPTLLPFIDSTNISSSLRPILFGLVLVVFLIFEPRGLAYRWEILRISWKIRPYSY
ncbi:MAG: branched-chain amino acid ABC transporter permease [Phototrophicaceae bacterium]